jgi:hypothetical protein
VEKVDKLGKKSSIFAEKNDENNECWMMQEKNCHGIYNGQKMEAFLLNIKFKIPPMSRIL